MSALRSFARLWDLVSCVILAVVGAALASAPIASPLTVVIGIGLVFLLPGYALSCVLWGSGAGLSLGDRFIFAVGLSVSVTVLSLTLLAVSGLGINTFTVALSLGYSTVGFSVVGMGLRWGRGEGLPSEVLEGARRLVNGFGADRSFWAVICALLVVAAVLVSLIFTAPPPRVGTAFYVTGPDGTVDSIPRTLVVNHSASLLVGIHNGQGRSVDFTVTVCLIQLNLTCSGPATFGAWSSNLSLTLGSNVTLNLSATEGANVERTLTFAVAVPGSYVISLVLQGNGVYREARVPLLVSP